VQCEKGKNKQKEAGICPFFKQKPVSLWAFNKKSNRNGCVGYQSAPRHKQILLQAFLTASMLTHPHQHAAT